MPIQRKKETAAPSEAPVKKNPSNGGKPYSQTRLDAAERIRQKAALAESEKKKRESEKKDAEAKKKERAALFEEVENYAAAILQSPGFHEAEPVKVALGVFLSLPGVQHIPLQDFAAHLGIHRDTVRAWRLDDTVEKARRKTLDTYFRRYTPGVMEALAKFTGRTNDKTGLGDASMIKLFLQVAEGWKEKTETDVTSGGQPIVLGLEGSQFVDPAKLPKKK